MSPTPGRNLKNSCVSTNSMLQPFLSRSVVEWTRGQLCNLHSPNFHTICKLYSPNVCLVLISKKRIHFLSAAPILLLLVFAPASTTKNSHLSHNVGITSNSPSCSILSHPPPRRALIHLGVFFAHIQLSNFNIK